MTELQVTEIINVINLTVIDQTTTTDYEITEVVETIHLTITEKFGSDGLPGPPGPASTVPGPKGDPGTSITKTSELTNDGEDGVNAFITAQDIPAPIEQVNSDWNATSGPSEILNKPTIPAPVDISTKAETDASNLTTGNVEQWRTKLNVPDLSINQIEITTTTSITTNTAGTGADAGKGQHMRSVLVKNGVNAITITLETTSHAKFEAIYYKKGSASITFLAGTGATLVKVANDGILNGAVDSNALVYRDGDTFHLYISNY